MIQPSSDDPMSQRPSAGIGSRWFDPASLKWAALWTLGVAVVLLLAGWWLPEPWRPAWARQRPLAFVILGIGALLMWLHARRGAEQRRKEVLSTLTHSSLTAYEFAPATMFMEESPALVRTQPIFVAKDASNLAPPSIPQAEDRIESVPVPALPEAGVVTPNAPPQWSAGLLNALEWRHFQALCEEIFKQDGYVTRADSHGPDNGADIWLHSRLDLAQPVRIVQCRNWSPEPIGVAPIREFLGAMVDAGLQSGAVLSSGTFSVEAEALARRHGITLVDGPGLLLLIGKRPDALQRELLIVATEGDYGRPRCRRCGLPMLAATTPDGAATHWVCEGAPRCAATLAWIAGPA